jgi:hypothetical protein
MALTQMLVMPLFPVRGARLGGPGGPVGPSPGIVAVTARSRAGGDAREF